jgi:hypothetical protein
MLVVSVIVWVVAWLLLVFVHTETVLGTGPALSLTGILLLLAHGRRYHHPVLWLGLIDVFLPVFFTLLVNLFSWSPSEAHEPFIYMGSLVMALAMVLTVKGWHMGIKKFQAWQCQHCGYALIHLQTDQCPECGKHFDPCAIANLQVDPSHVTD